MTWQSCFLLTSILLPLAGVAIIRLLPAAQAERSRWVALATALAVLFLAGTVTADCVRPLGKPAVAAPGTPPAAPLVGPGNAYKVTYVDWNWLTDPPPPPDAGGRPAKVASNGGLPIVFALGLDGLGLWLYALSALLMVTCVLVSWTAVTDRPQGFYAMLLILLSGMLGVFAARDLVLFYVFFEATLIPLYFLIGIWGGEQRRWAAIKFFIFTLSGSMLTFLGLLTVVVLHWQGTGELSFSIAELTAYMQSHPPTLTVQVWIFLALFAGFAIKVPLFPFHTWLPLAHVEAPTAGSILLAGVLLKIGTYGFIRFNLAMLPAASVVLTPYILTLSCAGIIYGALVALAQKDIKKLIAYSSVSHLGLCMLGMFSLNAAGLTGSALQMVGHGLSTGGLFAVVGMLYERYHTREIAHYGGMARKMPILAFFLVILTFASVGVPATSGFAAEFPALMGMFQRAYWETAATRPTILAGNEAGLPWFDLRTWYLFLAILSTVGMVFSAWYMLYLIQRIMFGKFKEPAVHGDHGHAAPAHGHAAPAAHGHAAKDHAPAHGHGHDAHGHDHHGHGEEEIPDSGIRDLNAREVLALAPLIVVIFWIGLCPQHFVKPMEPALSSVLKQVNAQGSTAVAAARPAAPAPMTSEALVMGAARRD